MEISTRWTVAFIAAVVGFGMLFVGWGLLRSPDWDAADVGRYAADAAAFAAVHASDVTGHDGMCHSLARPGGVDDMILAENGGVVPDIPLDAARGVWRGIADHYC